MAGGGGNDTVTYSARSAGVLVTLDGVFDDGQAGESDNVGTDIENAVGGAGDNVMIGSGSANDLTGSGGNDILDGAGWRRHLERRPRQRSRRQAEPATTSSSATTETT